MIGDTSRERHHITRTVRWALGITEDRHLLCYLCVTDLLWENLSHPVTPELEKRLVRIANDLISYGSNPNIEDEEGNRFYNDCKKYGY